MIGQALAACLAAVMLWLGAAITENRDIETMARDFTQDDTLQAALAGSILINEVLGNTTSTDAEYIELVGTPGASLDGLSLIVVEGDNGSPIGNIDKQLDFGPGDTVLGNGFFLVASVQAQTVYNVGTNLELPANFLENSSYTLALVETASLTGNTVTGAEVVIDAVGVNDGDEGDTFFFDAPVVGPDGDFLPAGVGLVQDGVNTGETSDWQVLDFNNGAPNDPTLGEGDVAEEAILINEVLGSTTGADSEYIELVGTPGASLEGLSIIIVEGDSGSPQGDIDAQFDFGPDDAIGGNGFFLIANETASQTYGVTPNAVLPTDFLENSTYTIALVETASITDTAVTGGETVLDSVGVSDGDDGDTVFFDAPVVGPDGSFLPAGVGRIEDGVDTDASEDWQILDFNNGAPNDPTPGTAIEVPLVINEVLGSTTGTDSEYVELFGTPGASLDGLSIIVIEGDAEAPQGTIDAQFDFGPGDTIGDNGFFLVANATAAGTYAVTPDLELPADFFENSTYTVALVETASIEGSAVTGNELVVDAVGVSDGGDGDVTFFDAPTLGPDGSFLPAGVGRVEDGVDTDTVEDWDFLNFFNDSPPNTPTAGGGGSTGGGDVSLDDDPTLLSTIQGSGDASPIAGTEVVIEVVVTGDYQNGDDDTFRDLGGFFAMEEPEDFDADTSTSEGIFVDDSGVASGLDVAEGDIIRVVGIVREEFGRTVLEASQIRIEQPGAYPDVSDLAVATELPGLDEREAFESMLIEITDTLTITESFDYEQFGEITVSSEGIIYQYSQLNAPDVEGNEAYQAFIADNTIQIDDGTDGARSDFDPLFEPDGDLLGGVEDGPRHGQEIEPLVGVMDFGFGEYKLRVPQSGDFEAIEDSNPRPEGPEDVGGSLKVVSFNVLNYFTTLDGQTDNGSNPRGADSPEELERQAEKLVTAFLEMDADVYGLIELENDFAGNPTDPTDVTAIQDLVNRINAELGSEVYAVVDPGQEFVGTDAIAVGFIYNTNTVELVGDAAILDTQAFLDPLDDGDDSNGDETPGGDSFNRAAVAQTFVEIESGGEFTAVVNHFKSKGSLTGAAEDADQGDGAGNNNATRAAAAAELAAWLETNPTGSDDPDVVILGDLNSYAKEEPIQILEEAGYTNLVADKAGEDTYGYRFSGAVGTLDYAMGSESLTAQVTGATEWNINSDEFVVYDYNEESTFGSPILRPEDQALFDGSNPARNSDHDPVIIGLELDSDRINEIVGNVRINVLRGTDEDDRIDGKGGIIDIVTGNGGDDVFVFTDEEGLNNRLRITDYTAGEDVIDLGGLEIREITEGARGTTIRLETDTVDLIRVVGITDADDIAFI